MGAGNSLRRGFLAGKQEWGRKTGGEGGGNCEIREKWVGKCFETAQNGRKTTNLANDANGGRKQAERTLGVPGKGLEQLKTGSETTKNAKNAKNGPKTASKQVI